MGHKHGFELAVPELIRVIIFLLKVKLLEFLNILNKLSKIESIYVLVIWVSISCVCT